MSNKIIIRVPKHKKAVRKYEFLPEIWDQIKAYMIDKELSKYCEMARIGTEREHVARILFINFRFATDGFSLYARSMLPMRGNAVIRSHLKLSNKHNRVFKKAAEEYNKRNNLTRRELDC